MDAPVLDNVGLASLRDFLSRRGTIEAPRLRDTVGEIAAAVRLKAAALDSGAVSNLSGGNQQKVVIGKWLLTDPRLLIVDEPTRGVDVGTRYELYLLIHRLAERGVGVLCISSDLDELTGLCDRLLVMSRGELVDSVDREDFDHARILRAAFGERAAALGNRPSPAPRAT